MLAAALGMKSRQSLRQLMPIISIAGPAWAFRWPLLPSFLFFVNEVAMSTTRTLCGLPLYGILLVGMLILSNSTAHGQQLMQTNSSMSSGPDRSTPALKYFGRGRQSVAPRQQQRRPILTAAPTQFKNSKPFQNIHRRPTISPYLSLDAVDTGVGLPNYYSRVLPLIEQEKSSRTQSTNLRHLKQQFRTASRPGTPQTRNGGVPTTGHSSQFLNHGSYFPTLRR